MRRFLMLTMFVAVAAVCWPIVPAQAAPVDFNTVTVRSSKSTVTADGIDQSTISVNVKTTNYLAAEGATVTITTSRGGVDEVKPTEATTDSFGSVNFILRSLKNGATTIMVDVNGHRVSQTVSVNFVNGLDIGLAAGSLIKIPSDSDPNTFADSAVYYYANNGRRYVFPNEKVYFTWYTSFDNVRILSIEDMSKIPIGGNITYHPGVKPVKFQTDDKVYAVYRNGELRWLKTEAVARAIYGENWTSKVDDISEAFYVNYKFGQPIENAVDFMAETIAGKYSTIEKDKGL
ncbi:MAG: invasin domain 3-containing protein [Patescibacteria group bacterium]|nr:invasin domain 3-containing protein [Patescibacteria group bacterium]